jgi:methyl-accepting chemotaxis protein
VSGSERGGSLQRRLVLLVVGTTGAGLLAAGAALLALDLTAFRRETVEHVSILAEVIGANGVASLALRDADSARETLASLGADPHVVAAELYTLEGAPFAAFVRDGVAHDYPFPPARAEGESLSWRRLAVFREIVLDGEPAATLYIEFDTRSLFARLEQHAALGGVVLVGACLLALLVTARLQREISRPILKLAETSRLLAEGDLAVTADASGSAEVAALGAALGEMAGELRRIVGRVREHAGVVGREIDAVRRSGAEMAQDARSQAGAVAEIASSVDRMSRSLQGLNAHAESLSDEARETATSVRELDSSLQEVAGLTDSLTETSEVAASTSTELAASIGAIDESLEVLNEATSATAASLAELRVAAERVLGLSGESRRVAERTRKAAQVGIASVQQAVTGIEGIREGYRAVERSVRDLSGKSEAVGEIAALIDQISDETALLSLNAEIIAAQAGEHGRAFSVVAQEVKELASRTADSAREITALIRGVQSETADAVAAVERGSALVESGASRTAEAGRALRAIGDGAEESTRMIHEIALAAESQAGELTRVEAAGGRVHETAVTIARAIRQQQGASGQISEAAIRVRELAAGVRRSAHEQRGASGSIAKGTGEVTARVEEMLRSLGELAAESRRISGTLRVFSESAEAGSARAGALEEVVEGLSGRSSLLEREVARFRT